ncbi:protein of unknown function DUF829 containing protein [Nitzschia inconspicua]|uniref:Uncharacterized protein n=1 Tax=Nitzschia inconspicua TaxID=303405 RepID=A0A9K3L215_9STRA|nr:protein of unknown function DUF829 containing protein [Nitzschia inconspicua]
MTISTRKRPLVVIAGWLGCRVSQLKHYEALYQSMGFDTFPLVVPTLAVIDRSLEKAATTVPISNIQWPMQQQLCTAPLEKKSTVTEWACYTLQRIHIQQPPYFLFHVFSNGGCFLWETVCRILEQGKRVDTSQELQTLTTNCKGVVFDSCPAWMGDDPAGLWKALQHCSPEDRQEAIDKHGQEPLQHIDARQRNHDYFHYLKTNTMDIPQLYLYSSNDVLSDANHISQVVKERQLRQTQPVLQQVWEESMHCAHMRQHPEDYQGAIKDFVQMVTLQSKL